MKVLQYPLATEKAITQIERNNEITFIVDFRSTKTEITEEFESTFKVKVDSVNIINQSDNNKKAVIKLDKAFKAGDVAIKLKIV
ncbi:MAG: 50S ribosomal protein L23 [Candidatus Marsarchaeota archaeon]|jgi:large subunit ribosomal protein L23|nr:50S ribosomal protein L23 [Candidatus Marsarchaeota archaeon]